jgi:hypothetical protein
MRFWTYHSQVNMVMDVSKDSHKAKLDDFLGAVDEYRFEMQYHQQLSLNLALKYFSSKWQTWSRVAFCMILLLNYFLLGSIIFDDQEIDYEDGLRLFTLVAVCQLIFSILAYVFHQVEFYPNLLYRSFKQSGTSMSTSSSMGLTTTRSGCDTSTLQTSLTHEKLQLLGSV